MPRNALFVVAIFAFSSEGAVSDELLMQFSGSLEGATNCEPASDAFCGIYTGTLVIDDGQSGYAPDPFTYDYTADVTIQFADGQTASCRAHPPVLPDVSSDEYRKTRAHYCLISLRNYSGHIQLQLYLSPTEKEISSVTLAYEYEAKTFDTRDLTQVLENLLRQPINSSFWVVGSACWWGPCVDKSVSRLRLMDNKSGVE